MTHAKRTSGFTLIELLLAMAFLTFLLLFMVTATIQIMRSYNKGLVLKQINQSSRTILEDMTRLVRTSGAGKVNIDQIDDGRFCINGTSYVWNKTNSTANKFSSSGNPPVTFEKVDDAGGLMCSSTLPQVNPAQATALIGPSVWVQDVVITPSLDGQLIQIALTLSTSLTNAPFMDAGKLTCGPDSIGAFCAFTTVTTTVNTRNGGAQ